MIKKICMILLMLFFTTVSLASNRYLFITNINQDKEVVAYSFDTETIKYTYSNDIGALCVDVWIKKVYTTKDIDSFLKWVKNQNYSEDVGNGLIVRYVKENYELNHYLLANNKLCLMGMTFYDKQDELITSFNVPSSEKQWSDIVPESVGEDWYKTIMAYAKENDELLKSRM